MPDLRDNSLSAVESYCLKSLERLRQQILYGYLVHRFDNILRFKKLWEKLESLKQKRIVKKIGVSLYNVKELEYLLNKNVLFDIIQLPYSIFDQRFDRYLPVLKERNIEIHARSIFLRGICFLNKANLIGEYKSMTDSMKKLRRLSKGYRIPLHSLCLCFVLLNSFIDKVIIGVGSVGQLKEDLDSVNYLSNAKDVYGVLKSLRLEDKDSILSYNWK